MIEAGRIPAEQEPLHALNRIGFGPRPSDLETVRRIGVERWKLNAELDLDLQQANNGAPSPDRFSEDTALLARLIQRDPTIRLAFIALGGWDTHVNQGSVSGQLANHLKPLGDGPASFVRQLGPAYGDTVILVVSESAAPCMRTATAAPIMGMAT